MPKPRILVFCGRWLAGGPGRDSIIDAMFLKAGALSLALLLASRLLGLARESAQAAAFGTSGLGDVAVLMLTLPDWLAGLLASGALAYVLLPHWARQPRAAQRIRKTLGPGANSQKLCIVNAKTTWPAWALCLRP